MAQTAARVTILKTSNVELANVSADEWVDSTGRTWVTECEWAEVNGRMEPVRLVLTPGAADAVTDSIDPNSYRPISAALIREMPIGKILADVRQRSANWFAWAKREGHEDAAARLDTYNRPRTKPLDQAELEQVADIYRAAWYQGAPPVVAVADALNLPHSTAAKRVMKARKAGLLPATTERRQKA
ncbi:MAG: hypothetical protein AB7Q42_06035 [Acidimicrobiia bacterium]